MLASGGSHSCREVDAKAVVSTVGGRGHESWAERGWGMEVTEHGLKDLTGSCLLCAPQVSPDSSSPSFFTFSLQHPLSPEAILASQGHRPHVTMHPAEGQVHMGRSKGIWPKAPLCWVTLSK